MHTLNNRMYWLIHSIFLTRDKCFNALCFLLGVRVAILQVISQVIDLPSVNANILFEKITTYAAAIAGMASLFLCCCVCLAVCEGVLASVSQRAASEF